MAARVSSYTMTIPAKTGSANTSASLVLGQHPGRTSSASLTGTVTWTDKYSTTVSKKVDRPNGCDKRGASATKQLWTLRAASPSP